MIRSPPRPRAAAAVGGEAAEGARRMRTGASDMGLEVPWATPRHSTSATIADRRFRAAIVVLRSLWRDPPGQEPSYFKIAHRRRVPRFPGRRFSYRPQRRRRGGLRHAGPGLVAGADNAASPHSLVFRRDVLATAVSSFKPPERSELSLDALDARIR